jgi:ATP-dependent RNA helicase DeaD
MITQFTDFNLHPHLEQAITELGYETPTPIQAAMIPVMLTGQDVIGQAQTGTGKTAAFALPILQNLHRKSGNAQALILTPTRELALQVANAFIEYSKHHSVRVIAVYGGQAYGPQIKQIKNGVEVVVGTPGRLMDLMDKKILDISHVRVVVLDEADEMLSMGFVEDIEKILASTPSERQTALFSATMPKEIRQLANKYMREPREITIKREQLTGETIDQRYYLVHKSEKLAALTRLFEMDDVTSALIFARTKIGTGELANELTQRGFPAEALNGDLSQDARERTLNRFRNHQIKVLVATDVAARGLDIDDISHVFNYDLPDDAEVYVHRIGRTGRAGKAGVAISLLSPVEKRRLGQIEAFARKKLTKGTLPTEQDIVKSREDKLLKQIDVWVKRGRMKREKELVEALVASGVDLLDIAAAALKIARAEEKQKPIMPINEVTDRKEYSIGSREERSFKPSGKHEKPGKTSHEAGMTRLIIGVGKVQGIRPNDIVGMIAYHADIPGRVIGKIFITDKQSTVDVPQEVADKVIAKINGNKIRGFQMTIKKA